MSDSRDRVMTIPMGEQNSNELALFEVSSHRPLMAYVWAPGTLPEVVTVEVHPDLESGGAHDFTTLQSGRVDVDLPAGKVTAVILTVAGRVRFHADAPVAADRVFRWLAVSHPSW